MKMLIYWQDSTTNSKHCNMAHYIDADRLRAEIDKRYAEYRAKMKTDDFTYYEGMADALDFFEQYIDSLPEQPKEGLDVTDFCKPIDPGIAQCVADHWWEMIGEESTNKKSVERLEEAAEEWYEKCPYSKSTWWDEGQAMKLADSKETFIAGAEWMAGQGWISVDEKLPEMDEEVIVLTDELDTAPIYKISFGHIVDVERCIDYNGWNIPGVKYWMPCPEIPNND